MMTNKKIKNNSKQRGEMKMIVIVMKKLSGMTKKKKTKLTYRATADKHTNRI